jgi:hypothetical protein
MQNPTTYYLICEDFVTAKIGPFPSRSEAEEHIKFLAKRGDAAAVHHKPEILTASEAMLRDTHLEMTPAQDREWKE